jgi:hypothetical protein
VGLHGAAVVEEDGGPALRVALRKLAVH